MYEDVDHYVTMLNKVIVGHGSPISQTPHFPVSWSDLLSSRTLHRNSSVCSKGFCKCGKYTTSMNWTVNISEHQWSLWISAQQLINKRRVPERFPGRSRQIRRLEFTTEICHDPSQGTSLMITTSAWPGLKAVSVNSRSTQSKTCQDSNMERLNPKHP